MARILLLWFLLVLDFRDTCWNWFEKDEILDRVLHKQYLPRSPMGKRKLSLSKLNCWTERLRSKMESPKIELSVTSNMFYRTTKVNPIWYTLVHFWKTRKNTEGSFRIVSKCARIKRLLTCHSWCMLSSLQLWNKPEFEDEVGDRPKLSLKVKV